ncbi:hypothetical protein VOLCADRAFT_106329 [Volvox carteri f. nagariensis]|uniref:Trs120/TRAPPC9 N-terminal domain-containing protein n=1 Tax=Volvox carteri f. nagariensis TaxID=3068 RepID=D8U6L5_VOLCA|nr:uncharacterized protein VOLCADRAFT_106329 [Volvox carteri f. nagariensis]EFJ44735.1 hypothetical protein VOLCADRAFT_106329 [Volvox carteri f. nagariensis]|eukprot:XP_002954311.1 hypothetical protein VOLCADRAFT_106329 [Volvox carteri f. nagariensis]
MAEREQSRGGGQEGLEDILQQRDEGGHQNGGAPSYPEGADAAVLPVGAVPRDAMEEYLELINRSFYRESPVVQAAAVSAAGLAGGVSKPPLQLLDWSNSYLHLRFLQLYPGRQVLAILGVVHCPMCSNVQQAYDEFKKICRSYPEALVTRCFVFEPSEDHIRQERDCQQLSDLVMFPPGRTGNDGRHATALVWRSN